MLIGFVVGILGHLTGARLLVAVGIALIFLGALLFPFLANVTTENKPAPIEESRGDSGF
jgi:hydrogenase-4 membrane subunit HyfE